MEINELMTLFRNGEYDKVIDNTNDTKNEDKLFVRAISFGLSNRYKEAVETLKNNEEILKNNLKKLIDVHIEICFWANELIDAQKALEHYEEYPYESQEVEEKFSYYKKEIEKRIKSANKNFYSEDDLIKFLRSKNAEQIQIAIAEIKRLDITPYIDDLLNVCLTELDESTRCLALILLYEKRYDKKVRYTWHKKVIEVIPATLKTPFQDPKFNRLLTKCAEVKDTTFTETFQSLLATYYLYQFPMSVEAEEDDIYTAVEIVTRKYLAWPQNKMRQSPKVEQLIKDIELANGAL